MNKNQKGFTVIEILLVFVLIALIIGGFFLIHKAQYNLSHTVTDQEATVINEVNKGRREKIEVSVIAYTAQPECHQDDPASLIDAVKNKGTGLYVGIQHTFKTVTDPQNKPTNDKPTNIIMKTTKADYPLSLDEQNSYLGANRSLMIFNFVTTDKATALALTKTEATISYTINGHTYTPPTFMIENCTS